MALIECIPNISEGRRRDVIDACARRHRREPAPGARRQARRGAQPDGLHVCRRRRPRCARASSRCSIARSARIDLRQHSGEHPRLGAVDVVPFVPIEGATMADCVALARAVAARGVRAARACRCFCTKRRRARPAGGISKTSAAASSKAWPRRCSGRNGRRISARRRRTRRPAPRSSARAWRSSPTTSIWRPTGWTSRSGSPPRSATAPAACAT